MVSAIRALTGPILWPVKLEIKSIEHILPVHEVQLLTCLRLSSCAVGLLLNFNTNLLKDGLRRFVNTAAPWIFVVLRVLRDKSYEGMNAPERGHDRPRSGPWIGFIRTGGGRNRC
jgi:PD-(D/E)XK nuclease superfamily